MELRDYLQILHKYWVSIVAITLLGVLGGAAAALLTTSKYEATTQLHVSVRGESGAVGKLAQGSQLARQSVTTYASLVQTESVLGPVIDDLGLDTSKGSLKAQVRATAAVNQSLINITVTSDDPDAAAKIANSIGANLKHLLEDQLEAGVGEDAPSRV